MAAKKGAKKSAKKGSKKSAKKRSGHVPLHILKKRYAALGRLIAKREK